MLKKAIMEETNVGLKWNEHETKVMRYEKPCGNQKIKVGEREFDEVSG